MMTTVKRLILSTCAAALIGCTAPGLKQADYDTRLQSVALGMSKHDFRGIFPKAAIRGAKQYNNGQVEVLEVLREYYSFMPAGGQNRNGLTGMEGQPQWFYFYNDKLIQFGNPEDWPANPDLVIQTR